MAGGLPRFINALLHILAYFFLDISSFVVLLCTLHVFSSLLSSASLNLFQTPSFFLSLQLTCSVTPRPRDVVSAHRKVKEVLIEQRIALVGPLSEAEKLDSHGDIPPQQPQMLHLAAYHTGQVSTVPLWAP